MKDIIKKLQEKANKISYIGVFLAIWFITYRWFITHPTPGIRVPELREELLALLTLIVTGITFLFYSMFKDWWKED